MTRTPEPVPRSLEPHLDLAVWNLPVDPEMLRRVEHEIGVRRHRRRRTRLVAVAAGVLALVPLTGYVVGQLAGEDARPPAGPAATSVGRVVIDGWSVAVPEGCVQQGDLGSMEARFGASGLLTDGAAARSGELRVRLSTAMFLCGSTRLSLARLDPVADPGHPGPAPLTRDADREEVLRVMAGVSVGSPEGVTGPLDRPRESVWNPQNGLAVAVPDPGWGLFTVQVGGGETAILMDVARSLRRE